MTNTETDELYEDETWVDEDTEQFGEPLPLVDGVVQILASE